MILHSFTYAFLKQIFIMAYPEPGTILGIERKEKKIPLSTNLCLMKTTKTNT